MDNKVVKIIIALFIPPLAVYLHEGKVTKNFWINIVLWFLLFGIGGIIHALYIVLK
ncbi:MAG: YqaE/Pmp3 family membrane protein [Chloroflexi bacterium]|nr:YqaE/Pmp3 family membrane protein [Chloroflexota bacterium]